jgi:hypothetical protein
MRFLFFYFDTLIGYSNLEIPDPSMGVVFGKFIPTEGYKLIEAFYRHRSHFLSDNRVSTSDQSIEKKLALLHRQSQEIYQHITLRTPEGDIVPFNFLDIHDYSDELPDERQIDVYFKEYEVYRKYILGD